MMLKGLHINPVSRKNEGRRHVLDLLLEKVHTERRFLEMAYYTWWFEYHALEVFEPINGFIPRSMWSEWERFVSDGSPELIEAVEDHDVAVENLRLACSALQTQLESSDELRRLYERLFSPEVLAELDVNLKELFGARTTEHHLEYLAQLIVNGTPSDCSPLYTIRPLWIRYGDEFLALRDAEPFRGAVADRDRAAATVAKTLDRIEDLCAAHVDRPAETQS